MRRPSLVIVGGAPGTGKTMLARHLAAAHGVPLLMRDEIKEALADDLGVGDRERSRELGRMAYSELFRRARGLLDTDHALIVEANFYRRESESQLRDLARRASAVAIECRCAPGARRQRFAERARLGERHPVHLDEPVVAHEWSDDVSVFAIDIGGPRLVVNTTAGYAPSISAIERFARGHD